MKHCPTCGSSYTDDTLVFCLQDGATLQSAGAASDPLSLVATLRGDSQEYDEETQDTKVSSTPTAKIPASALPTAVYQVPRSTADGATRADSYAQQPPNTTRTIIITLAVAIILLAAGAVGAWIFFRGGGDRLGRARRAAQANSGSATGNEATDATNTSNASQSENRTRGDNRADKGGRWFVILGSFPKTEIARATERMDALRRQDLDARIVSSDDYPNFKSGLWLVVMGPYTRNNAEEILERARPKVKDAYTKSGW